MVAFVTLSILCAYVAYWLCTAGKLRVEQVWTLVLGLTVLSYCGAHTFSRLVIADVCDDPWSDVRSDFTAILHSSIILFYILIRCCGND